jgi:hypothetical protein
MKKSLKKPVLLFTLTVGMAAFAPGAPGDDFTVPYGDDTDTSSIEDFGVMDTGSDEQMNDGSEMNDYQNDNSEESDNSEQITDDSDADNSGMPTDDEGVSVGSGMNDGQTVDSESDNNLSGQSGEYEIGDGIELSTGERSYPVSYQGADYSAGDTDDDSSDMDELEPEEQ